MELLKTIDPEHIGKAGLGWQERAAARAVVRDVGGAIGLLHVTNAGYYKLPGGGVESGEDLREALVRECKEELGVSGQRAG